MPGLGPLSNQRLGNKYLLGELLGVGGFGSVYRATNERLNRAQAIKVVNSQYLHDLKQLERFHREAQLLASLDHPNIITVNDLDVDEGKNILYLVMPFVEGGTLEDILKQKAPLSLRRTDRYLEQICAALDYAHAKGLVHLDLKPANLLSRADTGNLLLSDFGLAHLIKEGEIEGGSSLNYGTPYYMAPEQFKGQPQRGSDIYALGVILFRMLTGKYPFSGSSVIVDHLQAPVPSVTALRPDLPASLDQFMQKALAKNPDERFTSAGELLKAFRAVPAASPVRKDIPSSDALLVESLDFQRGNVPGAVPPEPIELLPRPRRQVLKPQMNLSNDEPIELSPPPRRQAQEPLNIQPALPLSPTMSEVRSTKVLTGSERKSAFLKKAYKHFDPPFFWLFPFLLLITSGFICETYSRSLLVTATFIAIFALLTYLLAYHKAMSIWSFILVVAASIGLIYVLSDLWLSRYLLVSRVELSSFWWIKQRPLYLGRQLNVAVILGSLCTLMMYFLHLLGDALKDPLEDLWVFFFFFAASALTALGLWLILATISLFFSGWGFGFGAWWYWSFLFIFIGLLGGLGLANFFHIRFTPNVPSEQ